MKKLPLRQNLHALQNKLPYEYAHGLRMMVLAISRSSSILIVLVVVLFMGVIFFASSLYFVETLSCYDG